MGSRPFRVEFSIQHRAGSGNPESGELPRLSVLHGVERIYSLVCNTMDCYCMSLKIGAILNSMIMHVSFLAIEIEI
jgi:hypothetical protein